MILLDLEMPGMGGLGALPKMIERASEAKILVVSSFTADGAEATVEALALGAADTLQKPASGGFDQPYREKLVAKIRALGRKPLRRAAKAATTMVIASAVPDAHAGLASGLAGSASQVGAALGTATFTAIAVRVGGGSGGVLVASVASDGLAGISPDAPVRLAWAADAPSVVATSQHTDPGESSGQGGTP